MNRTLLVFSILILGWTLGARTAPEWLWAKRAGGSGGDSGTSVCQDTGGNSYATGYFQNSATFGSQTIYASGGSNYDCFVAKADTSGNWLWATRAGASSVGDGGESITVDAGGNCYVAGWFSGSASFGSNIFLTSSGMQDVFVAKLSATGTWLWAKNISVAGNYDDYGYGICADADGNCYITGRLRGNPSFGPYSFTGYGGNDIFIAKLDTNGNWIWANLAGAGGHDYGYGIAVDPAGNCYVTGAFDGSAVFGPVTLTSAGAYDVFVAKADPGGNWLWAKNACSTGSYEYGMDIAADSAGNSHVTGRVRDTALFGPDISLPGLGGDDCFIAKLDTDGNWTWAKRGGSTSNDSGQDIALDGAGNSHVTGYFYAAATFGETSLPLLGGEDMFITSLDPGGNWLWAMSAASTDYDTVKGISTDSAGNSWLTGCFYSPLSFGADTITSAGDSDVFLAKLAPGEGGTIAIPLNLQISASTEGVQLSWDAVSGAGGYHVYAWDTPTGAYQALLFTAGESASLTWDQILALGWPGGTDRAFFRVTADTGAP